MKMKFMVRLLVAMFAVMAAGNMGWSQAVGSLVGTVADKSGAIVPGADVTLTNISTNVTQTVQSNSNGNFQFLQLLPSYYRVTVEKAGFEKFQVASIQVAVGNATRVEATLTVGATTSTIEVTSEAPLLSTQSSSLSYGVESKEVQQLPLNGRDPLALAGLVPGVVPQGNTSGAPTGNVNGWGNYQIGGGTANQSAMFIDGAPISVSYADSTILVPTQDSVQEFQIQTNNVSPEYGRFAGGVVNMATKSGTNDFHGTAYDYVRNAVLNANSWTNKFTGAVRPQLVQNQYGANLGGPALKDKAFFFLSWEQLDVHTLATTNTVTAQDGSLGTPNMYNGDFSALNSLSTPIQLYDPNNQTCGTGGNVRGTGTNYCAFTTANGYAGNNIIPSSEINQTAVALAKQLLPAPTNSNNPAVGGTTYNYQVILPSVADENQWTARGDENIGQKNRIFERFTDWHKNFFGVSTYHNLVGNHSYFGSDQGVLGDTLTITPTLLADVRLSFLRFVDKWLPLSCCNYNFTTSIGAGWAPVQAGATLNELPEPNISGLINFSGAAIILETDNAYIASGAFTKMLGKHTITFGGEMRKIEWDYAQSNSAGSTFSFGSGSSYSSSCVACAKGSGGWGLATMLLGYPTQAQTAEPALSKGVMWYSGLYVNDSFRMSPKLTINAGLRWEQPGSFTETHGRLEALLMNLPQPAVTTAMNAAGFSGTFTGGLGLINSTAYPHKDWQELNWKDYSPRVGFAYSPTPTWVFRSGFGISYLPTVVAFSLGPYDSPLNLATTTEVSNTAVPTINMTNPFPTTIATPPVGNSALQANINSLLGSGIQSPVPVHPDAYTMQWNAGFQKQLGSSAMVNVSYVGSKGVHSPLYSINRDQLPDQYDVCNNIAYPTVAALPSQCNGHYLSDSVTNPLSAANGGPIATTVPTLGAAKVAYGYLLKPNPQYLYMTDDGAQVGYTYYQALQVMAQQRFHGGGILSAAYTLSTMKGTADSLTAYLEASRYDVGGGEGVQDNNNINGNASNPGENSRSSFTVPNRLVINYVYPLPIGRGQRFLANASRLVDGLVGGWTVQGLTIFMDGFPLAFQDSVNNTLEASYSQGYAGPGLNAGASRPNFVPTGSTTNAGYAACTGNPVNPAKPSAKYRSGFWYNPNCYQAPTAYQYGNEPRVDPYVRAQGIDNTDLSVGKIISITERFKANIRVEAFNVFNWTQFNVPNDYADVTTSFGKITAAQYNQPRAIQMSGRFTF